MRAGYDSESRSQHIGAGPIPRLFTWLLVKPDMADHDKRAPSRFPPVVVTAEAMAMAAELHYAPSPTRTGSGQGANRDDDAAGQRCTLLYVFVTNRVLQPNLGRS